jgi:hypothetical protein
MELKYPDPDHQNRGLAIDDPLVPICPEVPPTSRPTPLLVNKIEDFEQVVTREETLTPIAWRR